jgi:hypothetical protein
MLIVHKNGPYSNRSVFFLTGSKLLHKLLYWHVNLRSWATWEMLFILDSARWTPSNMNSKDIPISLLDHLSGKIRHTVDFDITSPQLS